MFWYSKKVKIALEQATKAQMGSKNYNCTLSLISELDGVGQRHAAAALPPGETRYPLYRSLAEP
jgi:hypothetical protein